MKTVFGFIVLFGCLLFYGFAQSTEAGFDVSDWESSYKISKITDKYEYILYVFANNSRKECEVAMSEMISTFEFETEDFISSSVKATAFQFGTPNSLRICMQLNDNVESDKEDKNPIYELYVDAYANTTITKEEFLRGCKRELDNLPYNYKKKSAQALQTLERVNKEIW